MVPEFPEQTEVLVTVTGGLEFTVTTEVTVPVHPPEAAVIV
jgi:hypothetical protein